MPTPSIRWLKDGVKLEPDSAENMEFSVGRGPTHWLIIRSVKQSDAGKFSCIAENSKGTAWCAVNLSVHSDSLLEIPQELVEKYKGATYKLRLLQNYFENMARTIIFLIETRPTGGH